MPKRPGKWQNFKSSTPPADKELEIVYLNEFWPRPEVEHRRRVLKKQDILGHVGYLLVKEKKYLGVIGQTILRWRIAADEPRPV